MTHYNYDSHSADTALPIIDSRSQTDARTPNTAKFPTLSSTYFQLLAKPCQSKNAGLQAIKLQKHTLTTRTQTPGKTTDRISRQELPDPGLTDLTSTR